MRIRLFGTNAQRIRSSFEQFHLVTPRGTVLGRHSLIVVQAPARGGGLVVFFQSSIRLSQVILDVSSKTLKVFCPSIWHFPWFSHLICHLQTSLSVSLRKVFGRIHFNC